MYTTCDRGNQFHSNGSMFAVPSEINKRTGGVSSSEHLRTGRATLEHATTDEGEEGEIWIKDCGIVYMYFNKKGACKISSYCHV